VALLVETSTSFGRDLLRGVTIYNKENDRWVVDIEQRSIHESAPQWLNDWEGDGIISRLAWPGMADFVRRKGIPAIDINEQYPDLGLPLVFNDQQAIGRMGAEHLIKKGFRQFAFVGQPGGYWSDGRRDGFCEAVEQAGCVCDVFVGKGRTIKDYQRHVWSTESDLLSSWVAESPKPVGIMTCNAFRGVQLLDACRVCKIAVPEQVAVVAGDNEDIACEMAFPPLSAVENSAREIGYNAAAMLDALMHGRRLRNARLYIPPIGIVPRRSSDVMAIDDPVVSEALQFIHKRACAGIQIDDVVREMKISRTALQRRFRTALDQTVLDAIRDVRIARAKELLSGTPLSLEKMTPLLGYKHIQTFTEQFKNRTGMTPGQYRKQVGNECPKAFQFRGAGR
jgi:LacI family transcriptional regulator